MTGGYLLGLATLPAVAAAAWLLWQLGRRVNQLGDRLAGRVPLDDGRSRALFASVAACTRRAHLFVFGGIGVAVMVGWDGTQARQVREAVYPLLVKPARVNLRRRAAGPQDPGIDYSDADE